MRIKEDEWYSEMQEGMRGLRDSKSQNPLVQIFTIVASIIILAWILIKYVL